jgi:C-terminal processing protease CtpA/Prc
MTRILLFILLIAVMTAPSAGAANSGRNFGGVGIDGIPHADGQIAVRQLVAGGPAQIAGIRPGDIITHIDGAPTKGSDFNKMVNYRLRGRAGTKVRLNVQRPGEPKPKVFILTRRQLVVKNRK